MSPEPAKRRLETCAVHGLAFDPALHAGCPRCRSRVRATRGASAYSLPSLGTLRSLFALVMIVLLGYGTVLFVKLRVAGKLAAKAAVMDPDTGGATCAGRRCRPGTDACMSRCMSASGKIDEDCSIPCLLAFENCVEGCEPPLRMDLGTFAAVIPDLSTRPHVDHRELEAALRSFSPMQQSGCEGLERAYCWLRIDGTTGKTLEIQVLATPSWAGDCVSSKLSGLGFPKHAAAYDAYFVMKDR